MYAPTGSSTLTRQGYIDRMSVQDRIIFYVGAVATLVIFCTSRRDRSAVQLTWQT